MRLHDYTDSQFDAYQTFRIDCFLYIHGDCLTGALLRENMYSLSLSWESGDLGRPEHLSPLSDGRVVFTDSNAGTVSIFSPSGEVQKISPYQANTG